MNDWYEGLINEKLQDRPVEIKNKFNRIVKLCKTLTCDSVMEDIHHNLRTISIRHPEINDEYNKILDRYINLILEKNEVEELREIQVRNHQGELETRTIRVPRVITQEYHESDFNRGQPNLNPPKMVPFNFKRPWKFNGECAICMDTEPQSWCRVNCPAGHTFHCACIKEYTNTLKNSDVENYVYEEGNFNDQCPLCNKKFTELSELPDPQGLINQFGKKRKNEKSRDLEYLQTL
jgi:hypothetical protein